MIFQQGQLSINDDFRVTFANIYNYTTFLVNSSYITSSCYTIDYSNTFGNNKNIFNSNRIAKIIINVLYFYLKIQTTSIPIIIQFN